MSWWSAITTRGRLLEDICVTYVDQEIKIIGLRPLEGGEEIAILIDRINNKARLYAPLDECQRVAALHCYELVLPPSEKETFAHYISRFLSFTLPKKQKAPRG